MERPPPFLTQRPPKQAGGCRISKRIWWIASLEVRVADRGQELTLAMDVLDCA